MQTVPPAPIIDTHCHLEMEQFDQDRTAVIERARAAGIEQMLTVGSNLEGNIRALELAKNHPDIFVSVGIHPHDASMFTEQTLEQLRAWTALQKVVAIGETGLDYHYDHSPRDLQQKVFREHLELARTADLPVIIHSRDAHDDTLGILRESGVNRGVMHCFSGDRKVAAGVLSLGLHISIAGPVTFKKALDLKEIARLVPDESLLIETDAPYLAPEPMRGKRNEPAFLVHTARHIAQLRGITPEDLARMTTLNAKRLFNTGSLSAAGEIAYKIRDSLYLNVTNRCTNACTFCVKFHTDYVKGHKLRLDHEPSLQELQQAIGDPSRYAEVVFCGYGEPLSRLELVKELSRWIKQNNGKVRINTNGQANLIHKRNVIPELQGLVDSMSVSLDAQDEETYNRVCRPVFPDAYSGVINFIKAAKEAIPDLRVTVVGTEGVDVEKCSRIAEELGVRFIERKLDVVG